jgi:hypothetical protein
MSSAVTPQPADAPHWKDPRAGLPDDGMLYRVIAHQRGTDYIEMFDAGLITDADCAPIWVDEVGSEYALDEILVYRDHTDAEANA